MYCPYCGNMIDNDALYCPFCGQPTSGGGAPEQGDQSGSWTGPRSKRGGTTQLTGNWDRQASQAQSFEQQGQGKGDGWEGQQHQHGTGGSSGSFRRGNGRSQRKLLGLGLAALAVVALCVVGYLALFTKTFIADDALVGYFAVTARSAKGTVSEFVAIDAHEDGDVIIYYRDHRVIGTAIHDGEFHGSAKYRIENVRYSNGKPIDGVNITLAAPFKASKGEKTGVWAICYDDRREGDEYLCSDIALINDDGTSDYQNFKDKDVFSMEWSPREEMHQTWVKLDDGVYSFLTTSNGYRREVRFPA